MFSRKKVLLFIFGKEEHFSFHNWFVFFPLQLIFLDQEKRIVEIKSRFLPFAYYTPRNSFMYVIESPHLTDFTIGETLSFSTDGQYTTIKKKSSF